MAMPKKRKSTTRTKLIVVAFAILLLSSGLMVLFAQNFLDKDKPAILVRVACVGDSITEGSGYPDDLWMLLGNNYIVENFGSGGSTALLNSGKPYMNQPAFQNAKTYLPKIVVIMLGTNDAAPNNYINIGGFVDDYEKMIGEFQNLTSKPKIWIAIPPPIFNNASGPNSANLVQGVIPRIEQVAKDVGLPTIDVYASLNIHPEYFSSDGVHPTVGGAQIIANTVYKAITSTTIS